MIPFVVLLPGCAENPPAPTTISPVLAVNTPALPVPESRGPVEAAAKVFLRTVGQGTASPKDLSPDFKKLIAPPVFDADKALGYSDDRAETWLKALMPNASAASVACPLATADFGFAVAVAPKGRTLLRFVKIGHEWLVDWCQNTASDPLLPGSPSATDADEAGAWFASAAFVESIGQGQLSAAESFLTKPAMGKISPPIFEADNVQGFNRSKLPDELRKLVPTGTKISAFTLQKIEGGFSGTGEVKIGDATKTLRIVLIRGSRPGEWHVDEFTVSQ
jgi:hypothetical protein